MIRPTNRNRVRAYRLILARLTADQALATGIAITDPVEECRAEAEQGLIRMLGSREAAIEHCRVEIVRLQASA